MQRYDFFLEAEKKSRNGLVFFFVIYNKKG